MSKRIAICAGINDYEKFPKAKLRYAQKDAEDVSLFFGDNSCGNFDTVITLLNKQATRSGLVKALRRYFLEPSLTHNDLLVFYFSGHGAIDEGDNFYLVPHDVDVLPDGTVDITTTLHIRDIETILDNTKAGTVLCLFDACHSGGSGKLLGRIKYRDASNVVMVGAARYSEKAWEASEFSNGRFTEGLLSAASEKPTYGEWITLQQALTFIHNLPSMTNWSQTAEVSSHTSNQSIPLFKNSNYSLISDSFVDEIKQLCRLSGCSITSLDLEKNIPGLFGIREPKSFGRYDEFIVLCLDNRQVSLNEVNIKLYNEFVELTSVDGKISNGLLISYNEISNSLKAKLLKGITALTVNELRRNLIDFENYISQLVFDFEQEDSEKPGDPPLAKYYVELNAIRRVTFLEELKNLIPQINQYNHDHHVIAFPITEKRLYRALFSKQDALRRVVLQSLQLRQKTKKESKPVTELVNEWITDPDTRSAIILGSYGTGKTTFARKIAADLAKQNKSILSKYEKRIPILIPLRKFPKVAQVDIEAAIIAHLKQYCKVVNPDFSAFQSMSNSGCFVVIFDGFDEMAVQASQEIIQKNFREIMQLAKSPKAKVLITSRPEAFLTESEEIAVLLPDTENYSENPQVLKRIELLPLSEDQVEEFLQKRIPLTGHISGSIKNTIDYLEQLKTVIGIKDLIQRPVLLEMTIKALPKLVQEGGALTCPRLYDTYLRGEIGRQQIQKNRDFLISDINDRLFLLQLIAGYLYSNKRTEITVEQIKEVVKNSLNPEQRLSLDAYIRDLIACSFLIREGDQYRFSHFSFLEYLVAKRIQSEILDRKVDILKNIQIPVAVRSFLREILMEAENRNSLILGLKEILNSIGDKARDEVLYLGGNSITLLSIMNESLEGSIFSNLVISGAYLAKSSSKEYKVHFMRP